MGVRYEVVLTDNAGGPKDNVVPATPMEEIQLGLAQGQGSGSPLLVYICCECGVAR